MTTNQFITTIAPIIVSIAKARGYNYPSAIIAQACLESNYGKSTLSTKYFNYFGLKCGSKWKGKSVNMSTKEEYKAGTIVDIKANFRIFDNINAGIEGYFDFINTKRYVNLKTATSPSDYVTKIKADGYATDNSYVSKVCSIIDYYGLAQYDDTEVIDIDKIARDVIKGKYGSGEARKKALGSNYKAVQAKVNELLGR